MCARYWPGRHHYRVSFGQIDRLGHGRPLMSAPTSTSPVSAEFMNDIHVEAEYLLEVSPVTIHEPNHGASANRVLAVRRPFSSS